MEFICTKTHFSLRVSGSNSTDANDRCCPFRSMNIVMIDRSPPGKSYVISVTDAMVGSVPIPLHRLSS